jgi:hypothetical protein
VALVGARFEVLREDLLGDRIGAAAGDRLVQGDLRPVAAGGDETDPQAGDRHLEKDEQSITLPALSKALSGHGRSLPKCRSP